MNKTRVLLVDDSQKFTHPLKSLLESTGRFEVREENWAPKAIPSAKEFLPDAVLLDVSMPVMEGGELAARLREVPSLRHTAIVYLTCLVRRDEVDRQREPTLDKHSSLEEIIAKIDEQVARHAAHA